MGGLISGAGCFRVQNNRCAMHWPFSMHFSKMANQNVKQDTFKYTNGQSNSYRHDKMAIQFRYSIWYSVLVISACFSYHCTQTLYVRTCMYVVHCHSRFFL